MTFIEFLFWPIIKYWFKVRRGVKEGSRWSSTIEKERSGCLWRIIGLINLFKHNQYKLLCVLDLWYILWVTQMKLDLLFKQKLCCNFILSICMHFWPLLATSWHLCQWRKTLFGTSTTFGHFFGMLPKLTKIINNSVWIHKIHFHV